VTDKRLTIGYFNTVINQEWAMLPWYGAVMEAKRLGVDLVTFCGNSIRNNIGYKEQENTLYELARGGMLDGLISWNGHLTQYLGENEIADFYNKYGIPVVLIEGSFRNFNCIKYDNYNNMTVVLEHLIKHHGINRIGYIGNVPTHEGFQERYRAYRDVLERNGIGIDESLIRFWNMWDPRFEGTSSNEMLDSWLKDAHASGMQAIACSCDPNAIWIMRQLGRIGLNVPADIKVVGFDGFIDISSIPRLTTVRPSWEDLGSKAVDTVIKLIKGEEVRGDIYVSSRLIVSQSCGCIEDNVSRVGGFKTDSFFNSDLLKGDLDEIFKDEYDDDILKDVTSLFGSFKAEILNEGNADFISLLTDIMKKSIHSNKEIVPWQNVVSIIQNNIAGMFDEKLLLEKAYGLCGKARVVIGNTSDYLRRFEIISAEERMNMEYGLIKQLAVTFDIDRLNDILAEELPKIGIEGCYMSLFENPESYHFPGPVPEWSRLILAYDHKERIKLDPGGVKFLSMELIPKNLRGNDAAGNFIVFPLYFEDSQIGFIIYQSYQRNANTFDVLTRQISSGLKGTLLIDEVMDRESRLESVLDDLKTNHESLESAYRMLKLNQEKLLISEKMASIGRLTAGIAHEMNTPLASAKASLMELNGLVEEYSASISVPDITIQDHMEIASDMSKSLTLAERQIERVSGFIRTMKSQTPGFEKGEKERFNLCGIMDDAMLFLNHIVTQKKLCVCFDTPDEIELFGIPGRMNLVMTNILTNSIESFEGTGCTDDPDSDKSPRNISIEMHEDENEVTVIVADNGCGIPEENLSKIFDPMFSTKPFGRSAGMGLTSVHDIVYGEFGGTINVESKQGEGTTFKLILPKKQGDDS
jgi:signal transduction histidine kinase/DNA-binding LacI/PurR family transcriptional regulator